MQSTSPDISSASDFMRDPTWLIKIFHAAQERGDCIDADVCNIIRACTHLIDDKFRASPLVAGYFIDILRGKEVGRILRQMHKLEILPGYIPEFGAVKNFVRQEEYHQYAIDEHTLVAIENLDESTLSTIPNSGRFMAMLRALQKLELLRLALLLHDVGVGIAGPGGHEDKSLRAAKAVLGRLGVLDEADAEMVLFLIDNHLQMSYTAQHRDLDDRKVIQRFAKCVKDEKHLVMLYLFTFADMRAVGQGVWNDWNAALLWELYAKTLQWLRGEYEPESIELTAIQGEVNNLIGDLVDAKSIQKHFATMPPGQLLSSKPDETAKHIILIERLKKSPLVLEYREATKDYSEIIVVCARDELGLFSKVAGVLASQNINILSAQVNTREDGIVLDILNVTDGNTAKSIGAQRCQQVERILKLVLMGETDVETLLSRQAFSNDKPLAKATIAPKITINNDDSDTCTIIDVQAEDRIGLLYTILRVFYQLRLNLYLAKISTKGRRAVDVFYVQSENGYKILNQEKLHQIKSALEETLKSKPNCVSCGTSR
ncbi:TPA: ACT domain-containing protein [Candidatus Poribacteria bacterium]|nr:ACT domain-containing protein [Candidatus Poribacteria bacterium]